MHVDDVLLATIFRSKRFVTVYTDKVVLMLVMMRECGFIGEVPIAIVAIRKLMLLFNMLIQFCFGVETIITIFAVPRLVMT